MIEPAVAGVLYVPYYNPAVVYGPWPYPEYLPYYWAPPPGYVVAAGIAFGVGFAIGDAAWHGYWGGYWGGFDWWRGNINIHQTVVINNNIHVNVTRWQHDVNDRPATLANTFRGDPSGFSEDARQQAFANDFRAVRRGRHQQAGSAPGRPAGRPDRGQAGRCRERRRRSARSGRRARFRRQRRRRRLRRLGQPAERPRRRRLPRRRLGRRRRSPLRPPLGQAAHAGTSCLQLPSALAPQQSPRCRPVRGAARSGAPQIRDLVSLPPYEVPGLQRTTSCCAAPGTTRCVCLAALTSWPGYRGVRLCHDED